MKVWICDSSGSSSYGLGLLSQIICLSEWRLTRPIKFSSSFVSFSCLDSPMQYLGHGDHDRNIGEFFGGVNLV